ncbi:MAG: HAD family hydrolase [Bacteroidales bacterium]|nr:HAD family hydrolase [Bacteroides sp.]MCM1198526.1 HAD family hydrolase [Clostridium sp.]MCM1501620.1 HAD family hydrolase [Bacteroidales bacterium]
MKNLKDRIKVVAFDADDTLWDNQSYYDNAEQVLSRVLAGYGTHDEISAALLETETRNMQSLGYGAKAFTISLMETALDVTSNSATGDMLAEILNAGKSVLDMSAEPFPGVEETLNTIKESGRYRMVLFTKGDLLDQQNKIERSGLGCHFDHIEIVSTKTVREYRDLCRRMDVMPEEFLMIGNSFKSDIAPVLEMGGYGIHIPFERTWQHELIEEYDHGHLVRISSLVEIMPFLL